MTLPKLIVSLVIVFLLYFFSNELTVQMSKLLKFLSDKIGVLSTTKQYEYERHIYQYPKSLRTKLYKWVNAQIIVLGLKRVGVSVFGYLLFWGTTSVFVGLFVNNLFGFPLIFYPVMFIFVFVLTLVMTRVVVAERMELRESDIMNAIDLLVPEVHNGIENAIATYIDNFAKGVQPEFRAFLLNKRTYGNTFETSMYMLADDLGSVFYDFAQKAVLYERMGEPAMLEMFSDITESNRLRRQLRDENKVVFSELKLSFIISVAMTGLYFIFMISNNAWCRNLFLVTTKGKILLLCMITVIIAVLTYITTIRSRVL